MITRPTWRGGRRRALLALPVVALVAAGAWVGIARWRAAPPPTYTTTEAARGDVVQAVTASGTLSPVVQVQVGSQVSGRIAELLVDYNDRVTRGQVIARIDPQSFASDVAQAKARLTSARADLDKARAVAANAKTQHDRLAGLLATGAVARADVDAALADWRSADAQVVAARASINEASSAVGKADTSLGYTTIRSPIDGVVISRSVDLGQTVAASLSAPTLFVIAGDLREMELHTAVAESDVGQLTAGMKVEFTVDAFPAKTFKGTVKQVRYEATTVSNVVTYDAVVAVRNDDLDLRPGMTANARFVIDERHDVLAVPTRALRYRPPGAQAWTKQRAEQRAARGAGDGARRPRGAGTAVWVLRNGAPVRVPVETGLSDGTKIEITSGGLSASDLVITADSTSASSTPAPTQQRGGGGGRQGGGPPRIF